MLALFCVFLTECQCINFAIKWPCSHGYLLMKYMNFVRFGSVVLIRPTLIIWFKCSALCCDLCFLSCWTAFHFLHTFDALLHFSVFYAFKWHGKSENECTLGKHSRNMTWGIIRIVPQIHKHTHTHFCTHQSCFTPAHSPQPNTLQMTRFVSCFVDGPCEDFIW